MNYILSDEGYEVLAATDSKPLEQVHIHDPMLILMDNRLTDGYGQHYCKQFNNTPATRQYPIVLVSASTGLERMAAESEADGYLKKPFDIKELVELVKRCE